MLLPNSVHFSSARDNWETPQDFFETLNNEFRFTLDVCAEEHSAKCKNYFTKKDISILARSGFSYELSKKVLEIPKQEFIKFCKMI